MIVSKTSIILLFFLATVDLSQAKGWRGIVPLHSTRADVERQLGPPKESAESGAFYYLEGESVLILYSSKTCADAKDGWNVPYNTVISITVYPKIRVKLADLKLELLKYHVVRDYHVEFIIYYNNDEEGISIEVDSSTGLVKTFTYYPSKTDYYLRCPSPPQNPEELGEDCSRKFDSYSDIPLSKEREQLDNFAKQVKFEQKSYPIKIYIIVYAGRRARVGEAQQRAARIKLYLVNEWEINQEFFVLKDGGYREELEVELWIKPEGCRAPVASPTIDPKDVQIIKDSNSKSNGRR